MHVQRCAHGILSCPALPFFGLPFFDLSFFKLSFFNSAQHGIHGVSCVVQLHFYWYHRERPKRGQVAAEVDRILLGRDKTAGFAALPELQKFVDVFLSVGMMVTIERFGHRLDVCCPQLQHKALRTGNSAKDYRPRWNIPWDNSSPYPPDEF